MALRFHVTRAGLPTFTRQAPAVSSRQYTIGSPMSSKDLDLFLSESSWSVRELMDVPPGSEATPSQLRHHLRLCALRMPQTQDEEQRLLDAINKHLTVVQAIQSVDTTGIEPLSAIRDETKQGMRERTVTLDSLQTALEREEVVGNDGRIRTLPMAPSSRAGAESWEPLNHAQKTESKYFVVEKPIRDEP